jgi:preprotein translocase subunit SecB
MEIQNTKTPPLTLNHHFFPTVMVAAKPESVKSHPSEVQFGYDFQFSVEILKNPANDLDYQVQLTIAADEKAGFVQGYDIKLVIVGFVGIDSQYPAADRDSLVAMVGPTLLYGAAREFILSITLRGPFPPVYLPTVSFIPAETAAAGDGPIPKKRKKRSVSST